MQNRVPQETTTFSSKGQIVIPRNIREAFGIEEGTRVIIQTDEEGIHLKPVTGHLIRQGFGRFRGKNLLKALSKEKELERKK